MRFITEFELEGIVDVKKLDFLVPDKKRIRELGIGQEIGRAFGWQEKGQTTLHGPVVNHFSLEIEAFPMDKWIEFKNRFADALPDYDTVSMTRLINAMSDLESFGK